MNNINLRDIDSDDIKEADKCEALDKEFESSFTYHAIPLDEQMTLDENGIPFSLQDLMDLKELREGTDRENRE